MIKVQRMQREEWQRGGEAEGLAPPLPSTGQMLVVELALPGQPAPASHKPLEAACGQGLAFKSPNKGLKMWLQARSAAHYITCCTLEDTQNLEPLESWNLRLLSEPLNHRQHQNDSLSCYPCASHPPIVLGPLSP